MEPAAGDNWIYTAKTDVIDRTRVARLANLRGGLQRRGR
jgi:hypothetical protein